MGGNVHAAWLSPAEVADAAGRTSAPPEPPSAIPAERPVDRPDQASEPADADLLQRCRDGDAQAWDLLVRRYQSLVYSVALRNGLSSVDAADVTQTTFVALLDSITRLRADERLASWLMTVARRQAWRIRRRYGQEQPAPAAVADPGDPIADWEQVTVVHDALHRLGTPCRDLLVALYFDPTTPSYAQVAERLGRSIGGIGPMRARCLQRMRALLGEDLHP